MDTLAELPDLTTTRVVLASTLLLGAVVLSTLAIRGPRRFHPGPRGIPFLGNIFSVPKDHAWLTYRSWSQIYKSDIVHQCIAGTHIYIINNTGAAHGVFEKRSSLHSSKPHSVMLNELTGWDRALPVMEYGPRWKEHRAMFTKYFRPTAVAGHQPRVRKEVRRFLKLLLESPDMFYDHIRFFAGSVILGVVYGVELKNENDPLLRTAKEAAASAEEIVAAGGYLVDYIPLLKYIPAWFPGAAFKRQAAKWKTSVDALFEVPFRTAKFDYNSGNFKSCLVSTYLEDASKDSHTAEKEDIARNVAGIAFSGTSGNTLLEQTASFFLAMLLHPEIQRVAHQELDRVIGHSRLPELSDRTELPYITAIQKEVWRWRPPFPLGLPHASSAEDEYDGYVIPKGSILFGNSWAILHDEHRYPDPDIFNPSRFLKPDGKLNPDVPDPIEVFGHGRRICPGRHFATDTLWLAFASVLAMYKIEKPTDVNGQTIEPTGEYTPGMFSFPLQFNAAIRPRTNLYENLLSAE